MKVVFVLLSLILFSFPARQQAQSEKPRKGKRTLVSVPVAVSDREGRYISGLKEDDFMILQDGEKQKISFFATEEEPVSVALLLDTSGSTKDVLGEIREAAEDFIELMNPGDRTMIAAFDSKIRILQPFTSDKKALKNSLGGIRTDTEQGSVLLRAVEQLARGAFTDAREKERRKVIVLLSDGKDLGSPLQKSELLAQLEESDVLIYSIFYQTGKGFEKIVVEKDGVVREGKESKKPKKAKKRKKTKGYTVTIPISGDTFTPEEIKLTDKAASIEGVNFLQEMSDTTAGRFYQSDAPNFSRVFKQIAGELRRQYRLGFYTTDATGATVRNISVRVLRPDVVVRARGRFRAKQL